MIDWLLRHRLVALVALVAAAGAGGYFGLDRGRMSGRQPFPSGWTGAAIGSGTAFALAAVLLAVQRLRQ